MPYPLTLATMLHRSRWLFPKKEIVSRDYSGIHRYTYGDFYGRTARLAHALAKLGVRRGDRVGNFGWNTHRHLEAYFAVPCMGATVHTPNIRLSTERLACVVNHAVEEVVFVDAIPKTSVGKFAKRELREKFKEKRYR